MNASRLYAIHACIPLQRCKYVGPATAYEDPRSCKGDTQFHKRGLLPPAPLQHRESLCAGHRNGQVPAITARSIVSECNFDAKLARSVWTHPAVYTIEVHHLDQASIVLQQFIAGGRAVALHTQELLQAQLRELDLRLLRSSLSWSPEIFWSASELWLQSTD